MQRVAIYGIGGLYNYGCEAIVRGTVEFIRRLYPNSEITYYSKNYDYDVQQIKDIGIKVENIEYKTNIFAKCIRRLYRVLNIQKIPFVTKEFNKVIKESDIIFSVGGDIYSIPVYLRNKKEYSYVNKLVEFGKKAKKAGKKIIIYGASIGPFGNYKKAVDYYANHLNEVDQIICREQSSVEYLHSIGIKDNVEFLPDPAYLVPCDEYYKHNEKKEYLGVNLSALSLYEVYGNSYGVDAMCDVLEKIAVKTTCKLMLIPHVFSPYNKIDNDYNFLSEICNKLTQRNSCYVELVKPESFIDVKRYFAKCKFVICARMHCAVNAITCGVPAIFLSYSIKALGMAKYVYGDDEWVVKLNKIDSELYDKVLIMNDRVESIADSIKSRLLDIHREYDEIFNSK